MCALLMAWDKRCAQRHSWRVSENTLLTWAFLGGALGGKYAQWVCRHKTSKEPFRSSLNALVCWNTILYLVAIVPPLRERALFVLGNLLF
ncbi:DUF1294 domain-containing protein [Roseovarius rhodophyticola]|uniref:DUF1294 domain-containing protein n=1 Tax=Roseovarius rhodophyticola TaxID=3080827 RepID=A0ABZ2TL46_9RHOB|nr:DUF1294 domain-containing protein [Roseovarius sp. W115]MDV2931053.1 DUF1294 domain-containing protein [Roseovarius sp. W115]